MSERTTHSMDVADARLTYDVREPEEPGAHRQLFVFGSPMGRPGSSSWWTT